MNKQRESLSAMMDGELDDPSQVLSSLKSDTEFRGRWARFHLIGDMMRDAIISPAPAKFSEDVGAKVAAEPTILAPQSTPQRALTPRTGFAIAASIAALAVIGIARFSPDEDKLNSDPTLSAALPSAPREVRYVEPEVTAPALREKQPEVVYPQRRLNKYLVKFNEQRTNVGVPSVNPYVRIVGFEAN